MCTVKQREPAQISQNFRWNVQREFQWKNASPRAVCSRRPCTGIDPTEEPPMTMSANPRYLTVGDRFTCFSCELGFSVHLLRVPLAGGPWYHPRLIYVGPCLYKRERCRWPSSGRRHNWITATHCGLNWTEDTATQTSLDWPHFEVSRP